MGRFRRVLLIDPYYRGSYLGAHRPSPGLGYLSEYLSSRGIGNDVFDMMIPGNRSYGSLRRAVRRMSPDLVGVSMKTYRYRDHYAVISRLKLDFPGAAIVAGGPHISNFRREALDDCPAIDYGVCGEGEYTLAELCEGKEPERIEGLLYREGPVIRENPSRPHERRLESFPFPRYGRFDLFRYASPEIPIISSRGCPYACTFCSVQSCLGSVFRSRSAEDVVDELEHWRRRGFRRFDFADDNFTLDKERVYRICREIGRRGLSGLDLYCNNGVRADRLDRELLLAMKGAGFKGFAIGVESGSEEVLALVKKGESLRHLEQAVALSCELGFDVGLFFVIGLPGDTLEATEKSLAFALRYPVRYVYFWNYFPFPKTEAYEWVRAHGVLLDPDSYLDSGSGAKRRPLFHTREFPLSDRKKAFAAARKVSTKINRSAWEGRLRGLPAFARGIAARALMCADGSNTVVWLVSRIRNVLRPGRTPADGIGRGEAGTR